MGNFIFTLTLPDATGASRMVVHFAAAFRRRGHDVTLVHGPVPKNEASILPEMQAMGVETLLESGLAFPASPFLVGRLARMFRERRPLGVIGVQQRDRAIALQAAHRIGVPGFVSAQNTHIFWGRWPLNRLKERYYGWALRRYAKLVVCSSPVVQEEMVSRFGLEKERTAYLPNAIDLSQMTEISNDERHRLRQELGVQPNELMLVNVGRINVQKGQDLLLEAFRRLNPRERRVKLILVGGVSQDAQQARMTRYRDELLALVDRHQLNDQVVLAGWRSDVPALLSAADGYVHAARWEGFGIAAFEGMGAGRPTIWTNCWGRPDGFDDDVHGWLVPTEDVDALHKAMEKLISLSPDERARIGQSSRQFVEQNYDARRISDRFVQLIEQSVGCDKLAPQSQPCSKTSYASAVAP